MERDWIAQGLEVRSLDKTTNFILCYEKLWEGVGQDSEFDVQKQRLDPVEVSKSIGMAPKDPHFVISTLCVDLANIK